MEKEDTIAGLYFVYWNSGTRKCMVDATSEEEAIQKARRFCGNHVKIYRVEKLDIWGVTEVWPNYILNMVLWAVQKLRRL